MAQRRIHTIHRAASTPSQRPPLLFVHGGYVDSRCWEPGFLPFFASVGYDCYALDLSGHGRSDGIDDLDSLSLDDYLADVLQVIESLPRPPIVVGHSMGAFLAERLLEQARAVAGVLISPVPPTGTLESAVSLFLRYPQFVGEVFKMSKGVFNANTLDLVKEVYFSSGTSPETLLQFAEHTQPESMRAICDMALLCWRWPPSTPPLPVLVLGGELDRVFPPYMIQRVARRWNAELQVVPAAGHAMIVDEHWQACARRVLEWLRRFVEQPVPREYAHRPVELAHTA